MLVLEGELNKFSAMLEKAAKIFGEIREELQKFREIFVKVFRPLPSPNDYLKYNNEKLPYHVKTHLIFLKLSNLGIQIYL